MVIIPPFLIPTPRSGICDPRRKPLSCVVTQDKRLVDCGHRFGDGWLKEAEPGIEGSSGMLTLIMEREELELYDERCWTALRGVRSGLEAVEGNVYWRFEFSCCCTVS
jgi:hypothetical protein